MIRLTVRRVLVAFRHLILRRRVSILRMGGRILAFMVLGRVIMFCLLRLRSLIIGRALMLFIVLLLVIMIIIRHRACVFAF